MVKHSIIRGGVALVAAGSLMAGCASSEIEPRTTNNVGLEYDLTNGPANEAIDAGIVPNQLPYEDVVHHGNIRDPKGLTTYHQVAGLTLVEGQDGEKSMEYKAHPELSQDVDQLFKAVLTDSEDLITAAANSGNLEYLIFNRGLETDESTSSHYNPYGNVVAITFDEENASYDELVATARHELWHALTKKLNFTEEEWNGPYKEACDKIDALYMPESLAYLKTVVDDLKTYLEDKKAKYPEDHAKMMGPLEAVDQYLEAGNGADDIWLYCGQLSVGYAISDLERAALNIPENGTASLGGFIYSDTFDDMDHNSDLYRALKREFIEGDTVYADVSEFSYVQNEDKERIFLGHAAEADNFDEIWASILNTATYYTDEFADKVATMHPAEREFVMTFLNLTINHTIELNPELATYLTGKRQQIHNRVNQ